MIKNKCKTIKWLNLFKFRLKYHNQSFKNQPQRTLNIIFKNHTFENPIPLLCKFSSKANNRCRTSSCKFTGLPSSFLSITVTADWWSRKNSVSDFSVNFLSSLEQAKICKNCKFSSSSLSRNPRPFKHATRSFKWVQPHKIDHRVSPAGFLAEWIGQLENKFFPEENTVFKTMFHPFLGFPVQIIRLSISTGVSSLSRGVETSGHFRFRSSNSSGLAFSTKIALWVDVNQYFL